MDTKGLALIIGARGGIGSALVDALRDDDRYSSVIGLSRGSVPAISLCDEDSIVNALDEVCGDGTEIRLVIDATGFLHNEDFQPERSARELTPEHMAYAFAINAIGPALLMKHILPRLPRKGRSVFATLSARVGSISDNRLGGWHSYRASKAALNQLVRTCSIELGRTHKDAVCVALHPGTVATPLSEPFAKRGLDVRPADVAARDLLAVIDQLTPKQSGDLFDHEGLAIAF
ncbi:SDR family oxidoreductase [Maricaulis sp. CAU 1757]